VLAYAEGLSNTAVTGRLPVTIRELEEAIRRYIETTNDRPKPFRWSKTADEILASVIRLYNRISDSGHQGARSIQQ
jgi:hypothetical protein